jgi:hypothetical protein
MNVAGEGGSSENGPGWVDVGDRSAIDLSTTFERDRKKLWQSVAPHVFELSYGSKAAGLLIDLYDEVYGSNKDQTAEQLEQAESAWNMAVTMHDRILRAYTRCEMYGATVPFATIVGAVAGALSERVGENENITEVGLLNATIDGLRDAFINEGYDSEDKRSSFRSRRLIAEEQLEQSSAAVCVKAPFSLQRLAGVLSVLPQKSG